MFDDNVTELKAIIEKQFNKMDESWKSKESNEVWERFFKENFLKNDDFNVSIYYLDNFINYKINKENMLNKKDCNNLLGYNRIINENGDFFEFFGFYVDIVSNYNYKLDCNCSIYVILYYSKEEKGFIFHVPEEGNTLNVKKKYVDDHCEFTLMKNDNNAFLDFSEIKKDLFQYFFDNKINYNEAVDELLDAIKALSDNKNIDNLINGFYEKFKGVK